MALLDFLFGRTKTVPTTTTVQQSSKLPEEIAPFVKEVLGEAQTLYGQRKEEGFKEFPGETVAPRTAEELAAMQGLRGLVGTQEPYRAEAEGLLRATPTQFTADEAQRLMSPYQRAVTDIEKREAQRNFERQVQPALEAKAIQQGGGMSGLGTRAALEAAEAQRTQSQLLSDIEAKGQQRAFEQAYRQFGDEINLQRQKAGDIQQQGQQQFNIGLAERGLQQQLGQEDRAEAQALLNEQFAEFIEREQFPESTLAQYSSFVYGNPFLRQADTSRTTTGELQPTTSMGQGLLNLGLTGLNIYGRGYTPQGFSMGQFGKSFARAGGGRVGGGLAALPIVRRAIGGPSSPTGLPGYVPTERPMVVSRRTPKEPFEELLRKFGRNVPDPDKEALAKINRGGYQGLQKKRDAEEARGIAAIKKGAKTQEGFRDQLKESQMAQFEDSDMLSQPIASAVEAINAPGMETKGFINQLAAGLSKLTAEQDKMSKAEKKEIAKVKKDLISADALAAARVADQEAQLSNRLAAADEKILLAKTQAELNDANFDRKRLVENLSIANTASTILARLQKEETDALNALAKKAEKGRIDGKDVKLIEDSVRKSFGFTTNLEGNTVRVGTDELIDETSPEFAQINRIVAYLTRTFKEAGKDHLAVKDEQARITPLRQRAIDPPMKDGRIDTSKIKVGKIYNMLATGGLGEAFKDAKGDIQFKEII